VLPLVHVLALLDDPEHGLVDFVPVGVALVKVRRLQLKQETILWKCLCGVAQWHRICLRNRRS
jgi:hypothetical protein